MENKKHIVIQTTDNLCNLEINNFEDNKKKYIVQIGVTKEKYEEIKKAIKSS